MARTDDEALEAPTAPLLRAAPLDAALLVAVHRGLEAVPTAPVDGAAAPEGPADARSDRLTRRRRT